MLKPATVAAIRERIEFHEDLARRWSAVLEHLAAIDKNAANAPSLDVAELLRMERRVDYAEHRRGDGEHLLSTKQAGAYVGLAVQTLACMRITGESPPFHKLGRRVFYKRADLDVWVATRRRRSTSDPGPQQPPRPRR